MNAAARALALGRRQVGGMHFLCRSFVAGTLQSRNDSVEVDDLMVPASAKKDRILSSDAKAIIDCLNGGGGLAEMSIPLSPSLFSEVVLEVEDSDKALEFFNWSVSRSMKNSSNSSRFTVRMMSEALNRMNRREESHRLFQLWKLKSLPALMIKYSQQGNLDAVLGLLKDIADHQSGFSVRNFNSCLEGLCKAGSLEAALRLLVEARRTIVSLRPSVYSYSILLHALRAAQRSEEVYELLRDVRSTGLKADEVLYSSQILNSVEEGEIDKAMQILQTMADEDCLTNDSDCYGCLIKALYQTGRSDEACELAAKVGCESEVLNSLIQVLLEKGRVGKARELVEVMAAKHGSSSVKVLTYNNVLNALCKDPNNVEEAFELLNRMESLDVQADKYTYSILITRLCKSGMVNKAKALVEVMVERGCAPDARTYNSLVEELCKSGKIEEADKITEAADAKNCTSVFTYNNLLSGFLKAGQLNRALDCLEQMLKRGPVPDVFTYNIFMEGLCRLGQWKAAWKLLPSMNREGVVPDVVTYNTLIEGIRNAGKFQESISMMREMSERGCDPNIVTFTALMKWYTRRDKADECAEVFQSLLDRGLTPNVFCYNTVISALCKAGRLDQAHRLFGAMVSSGCSPNAITYRVLIHGLCMRKELDKAVVLLETMNRRGCTPDVTCYNSIVAGFCRQGRIDEAFALLEGMPCAGDKVLFRTLVRSLCKLQLRSLSDRYSVVSCDEI